MRAALARHDALAADLIDRHGGALVKSRGEGDSLFAVFARGRGQASFWDPLIPEARRRVREALSEAAWTDAAAAGRELTLNEAIALVMPYL
jgi:class 3 adenylate cyclase